MNQAKITDIFPEPTYEELENALKEWMNPEGADSDVTTTEKPATAKADSKTEPVTEKKADVSAAFDDLFNS